MVGQEKNRKMIDKWALSKSAPQFIVIVGSKGSGKKTLAHYIANRLNKEYVAVGIKVDEVRDMIDLAYRTQAVYVMEDADTMSTQAKNSLLKIAEEPPADTYFIMTITDESSILDTIRSRARLMYMETYYEKELRQYKDGLPENYYKYADTPWMLDKLIEYGEDFLSYVSLVVDNICEVESANAFKSASKLAIKTEEGYDLSVFFQVIIYTCIDELKLENATTAMLERSFRMALITSAAAKMLDKLGVNKQQLYDMWVMEVRSIG